MLVLQSPEMEEEENTQAVQEECLEKFASNDYIMEPEVFNMLKRLAVLQSLRATYYCVLIECCDIHICINR